MRQKTTPIEQIIELYSIRGHRVTELVERSQTTTDLLIQAKQGQKWLARYIHVGVVDSAVMRELLLTKQAEKAVQASLITDGAVAIEARLMADGLTVHVADQTEFNIFLLRARNRAYKGIPGFLRRIMRRISRNAGSLSAIPRSKKYTEASTQPATVSPTFPAAGASPTASTMFEYLQACPPWEDDQPLRSERARIPVAPSQTQHSATRNLGSTLSKGDCPHGAGRRENCAICLGQREYERRYGDWQSD